MGDLTKATTAPLGGTHLPSSAIASNRSVETVSVPLPRNGVPLSKSGFCIIEATHQEAGEAQVVHRSIRVLEFDVRVRLRIPNTLLPP